MEIEIHKMDVESEKINRISKIVESFFTQNTELLNKLSEFYKNLKNKIDYETGKTITEQMFFDSLKETLVNNFLNATIELTEDYINEILIISDTIIKFKQVISFADFNNTVKSILDITDSKDKISIYKEFLETWKSEFMYKTEDTKLKNNLIFTFNRLLREISEIGKVPKKDVSTELVRIRTKTIIKIYKFREEIEESFPDTRDWKDFNCNDFINKLEHLLIKNNKPEEITLLIELFNENRHLDRKKLYNILSAAYHFASSHGFSEENKRGFIKNIVPKIIDSNPTVDILQKHSNFWAVRPGEFGLGDFVCFALSSQVTSLNINRLLMAVREIPTTSYARLEQNRKDALLLVNKKIIVKDDMGNNKEQVLTRFGALRDFIHDQRPMVNEVIKAMIKYYNTKNPTKLKETLSKIEYLRDQDRMKLILDLENYEGEVEEKDTGEKIMIIDLLKRLAKNTEVVAEKPQKTNNRKLNMVLNKLNANINDDNIKLSLEIINKIVEDAILNKEIGIEPSIISAITFIERKIYSILQKLDYDNQRSFYKKSWFIDLLKFQELTCSNEYNLDDFNVFVESVRKCLGYEEVYTLVGNRVLGKILKLSQYYTSINRNDLSEALWSGNITHDLSTLSTARKASTVAAAEYQRVAELHPSLREHRA